MDISEFFTDWPFSVVPDQSERMLWAGRPDIKDSLTLFQKTLKIKPNSTIDLLWAAFGSGKTHLLYYLKQESSDMNILPWYCIPPKSCRNFLEYFTHIMKYFPLEDYIDIVFQDPSLIRDDLDIYHPLHALKIGNNEQKIISRDWLRGKNVDLRQAKKLLNIPYKINSDSIAVDILIQLITTITSSKTRFIILIDEYQRIRSYKPQIRDNINSAFLDIFNACPKYLSVLFTCSSIQRDSALSLLSPELLDRMKGRRPFSLPTLNINEAHIFLKELLQHKRPSSFNGNPFGPFSEKAIQTGLELVNANNELNLIPRHIIQFFDHILTAAINSEATQICEDNLQEIISKYPFSDNNSPL